MMGQNGGVMTSIYSLTIFTSAFLLFIIQPMVSKILLPHLGGTPAVWNTSMVFFQTMLLLGYVYAHVSVKWLGVKRQAWLHGILLLLSLAWLPVSLHTQLTWVDTAQPVGWVLAVLGVSVGVPFFLLSANAPLIQAWLAHTTHKDAGNPYFLYSASNIGSMLALFCYPLLAEPLLTLAGQTYAWSVLYVLFMLCLLCCARLLYRHYSTLAVEPLAGIEAEASSPTLTDRLRWVLLAFFPSSLLLGVTTFITTDIASAPLLWIIPLAIYLLTFIFAFARNSGLYERALNAQVVLVPLVVLAMVYRLNLTPVLLLHLFVFFAIAMGCHGRLAQCRPDSRHLTGFYVCLSLGGMLGGMFNALAAPQWFTEPVEYPLILILSLLARPLLGSDSRRHHLLDFLLPMLLLALLAGGFALARPMAVSELAVQAMAAMMYMMIMSFVYVSYRRPIRFTLLMLALFIALPLFGQPGDSKKGAQMLYAERNFFGVNRVFHWEENGMMILKHGTTIHGIQGLSAEERLFPGSYYSVVRDAMHHLPQDRPVGLIGLGAGTLACAGRTGQRFDFYEIDPVVARIARNPEYFTFLRDCGPDISIALGDGRLEIAKAADGLYGVIVVDAFTSDAIPLHLLTREALSVYLSKLSPGGVLAFNISNRHLNLEPVMSALAKDAQLSAFIKENMKPDNRLATPSVWVIMTRNPASLAALLAHDSQWKPLDVPSRFGVWTDDFSNILQTLF